jgi:hypothetical protein
MKIVMTFDDKDESDHKRFEILKQADNMYWILTCFDAFLYEDAKNGTTIDEVRARWQEIHKIYQVSYDL